MLDQRLARPALREEARRKLVEARDAPCQPELSSCLHNPDCHRRPGLSPSIPPRPDSNSSRSSKGLRSRFRHCWNGYRIGCSRIASTPNLIHQEVQAIAPV